MAARVSKNASNSNKLNASKSLSLWKEDYGENKRTWKSKPNF